MAKSALTKAQRAHMGDTMDGVARIFNFEQLSFEAFEQCRTVRDIADYLHDEIHCWIKFDADSPNEAYTACLKSFNREMRRYFRKPVLETDLDRPLTELFEKKRWPVLNSINHWFYVMGSSLSQSVPELTRKPWVLPTGRRLWIGYWILLMGIMIVLVLNQPGWIELPDSVLLWGTIILIMLSPFILIVLMALLPSSAFYTNPEPNLTLRTVLIRYAQKLREKHGECELEYIQSQLLKNWESDRGVPGTIDSPVPWLDK